MPYTAHALVELSDGTKYARNDSVPDKVAEANPELIEGGAFSKEPYDPEADKSPLPETVEIEGVRYIKVSDAANSEEKSRA